MKNLIGRYKWVIVSIFVIFIVVGSAELWMGRLPWGPDGKFGWWEGSIWSSEQSQRVADVYTFSHLIHGMLFYAFLWLVARKVPVKYRFIVALLMEASWEVLENSPIIINRYREATMALGYAGDSILNSLSDIMFCGIGFIYALKVPRWLTVVTIISMELGTLYFVRDNLTLNVIMLLHPIEAIKVWQSAGQSVL